MSNFERLTEMVKKDRFLYKTICDVVGERTSTEEVYEIWCELHKQERWSIADIERIFYG